ncbi:MAG: hypothetical protein ACE5NN_01795 [Candidatus Bathyarchaeia archaeon]
MKTGGNAEPIYSPPSRPSDSTGLQVLINVEWEIIEKLKKAADEAKYEKHRAQLYLALSSHVKALAQILKMSGAEAGDDGGDLAKLLGEIAKKARRIAEALNHARSTRKSR